jgi:hypothetical protein
MEYRGIRYTVRVGIERGQYRACIHPDDEEMLAGQTFLSRRDAKDYARQMINRWLTAKSRRNTKGRMLLIK